jgi:hypothetical protein
MDPSHLATALRAHPAKRRSGADDAGRRRGAQYVQSSTFANLRLCSRALPNDHYLITTHMSVERRCEDASIGGQARKDYATDAEIVEEELQWGRKERGVHWLQDEIVRWSWLELSDEAPAPRGGISTGVECSAKIRAPLAKVVVAIDHGHARCAGSSAQTQQRPKRARGIPREDLAAVELEVVDNVDNQKCGRAFRDHFRSRSAWCGGATRPGCCLRCSSVT